jgi:hypothetical protein
MFLLLILATYLIKSPSAMPSIEILAALSLGLRSHKAGLMQTKTIKD